MMKMWLPVLTPSGFKAPRGAEAWQDTKKDTAALVSHYALHWAVAFAFFILYLVVMLGVTVPSWEYTLPGHYGDPTCVTTGQNNTSMMKEVCTKEWVPEVVIRTECDVRGDLTPKCILHRDERH